jgi:hypothetical protein
MISLACASDNPRGSASFARLALIVSRCAIESSEPMKTIIEVRPSSVVPIWITLTRGDFAASAE